MAIIKEYRNYDGLGLAELVRTKQVSPAELLDTALALTERLDPKIAAVVLVQEAKARAAIKKGLPQGPFTGVPFLLKDLGAEAIDFPTHMGSRLFKDFRYSYDSEIFIRCRNAGLVTFGRTTSPEFGIGPVTEAGVYGRPTRNPWNLDHTSGGSSGGAGAAVAAGILPVAHGSDGGGSVRIPASSCGLFGFKPTRARLPDGPGSGEGWGGMAIDGFLTRSVRDTAALIDACHGPDLGAPYWAPAVPWPYMEEIRRPPGRLRIAVCNSQLDGTPIDKECKAAVDAAAKLCASLGHEIIDKRPAVRVDKMMQAWTRIVAAGTVLTVRSRERALGRSFGPEDMDGVTWGACQYGKTVSGADYLDSLNTVHDTGRQMARFFLDCDVLLTATLGEPPAKVGRFKPDNTDFLDYRLGPQGVFAYSPFTALFNATGQPAMSVPLHWTKKSNLPVGVHFAARFGEDGVLFKLAAQLEQAKPWFDRRPEL